MDDSLAYKFGGLLAYALVIGLFWSAPLWMALMMVVIAAAKSSR